MSKELPAKSWSRARGNWSLPEATVLLDQGTVVSGEFSRLTHPTSPILVWAVSSWFLDTLNWRVICKVYFIAPFQSVLYVQNDIVREPCTGRSEGRNITVVLSLLCSCCFGFLKLLLQQGPVAHGLWNSSCWEAERLSQVKSALGLPHDPLELQLFCTVSQPLAALEGTSTVH